MQEENQVQRRLDYSRHFAARSSRSYLLAALIGTMTVIGCSSAPLRPADSNERKADRIVVRKSDHTMTLMEKGSILKVYKVALGRGPAGPKDHQGDHKTPEGGYVIDQKNAQSRFHLALHVSYPNTLDRNRARHEGVDPGGAIMVHGVEKHFAWLGSLQHDADWTDGCIALTNPEIEEVWRLVPVGTPIEIKP